MAFIDFVFRNKQAYVYLSMIIINLLFRHTFTQNSSAATDKKTQCIPGTIVVLGIHRDIVLE
jgi:hypothetical protein